MFDFEDIAGLIRRLWWGNAVELLVIGGAVYAVMRFLRGTRGARLLRGFVLVLAGFTLIVFLAADRLELERLRVLYLPFIGAMFFVALVVFQPELRRALIRLGGTRWFIESSKELDTVIEEVVTAAGYLSKNKIGALVAFERVTEFGGLMETGCRLDAEVTSRLLTTIFWPGSSLHDMGVIISHGRVAAAAVQFPLTDSTELDTALGSRHRAAVGLSEDSDAVILVVSEETGVISVVEHGALHRHLTPDALRQMLRTKLSKVDESEAPKEDEK